MYVEEARCFVRRGGRCVVRRGARWTLPTVERGRWFLYVEALGSLYPVEEVAWFCTARVRRPR